MSKPHEYSKIEHITDKKSKKAFFAIPNLGKIKKSDKKIQFISFLAEWCPNQLQKPNKKKQFPELVARVSRNRPTSKRTHSVPPKSHIGQNDVLAISVFPDLIFPVSP